MTPTEKEIAMNRDAGREIAALGLEPDRARRLLLLPLAYVAAASRRRDLALLDRLIESSVGAAQIDPEGAALAHGWLRDTPTSQQFRAGLSLLRTACETNQDQLTVHDLIEAVLWACSAAQLDREKMGRRYTSVSAGARRAMGELEAALGVEVGDLWSDVMEELGEQLPRSTNIIAPQLEMPPESAQHRPG
jgi:hypothetical protein